jgi:hypothetical protein
MKILFAAFIAVFLSAMGLHLSLTAESPVAFAFFAASFVFNSRMLWSALTPTVSTNKGEKENATSNNKDEESI